MKHLVLAFLSLGGLLRAAEPQWQELFDGRTLANWRQTNFEGGAAVKVQPAFKDGRPAIVIEPGVTLSGLTSTLGSALPRTNYEITLEAMRLQGGDFFCALTFPVGQSACTFVVGGWGGVVIGISSVNHADASDNETTQSGDFVDNRWYRIRVRVTDAKIEAWIDKDQMVDLGLKDRKVMMRPGDIEKSQPLGLATFQTRAAMRDIRLRRLTPAEIAAANEP
jgi:hypothetical protein